MGLKQILAVQEIPLNKLNINEGDWILLAKDNLKSFDKKISDNMPSYVLSQFKSWENYKYWLGNGKGMRLFQKGLSEPTIMRKLFTIQIFPPEIDRMIINPHSEIGPIDIYHVNRAYVGKKKIVRALKKDRNFAIYAKIFGPQIS